MQRSENLLNPAVWASEASALVWSIAEIVSQVHTMQLVYIPARKPAAKLMRADRSRDLFTQTLKPRDWLIKHDSSDKHPMKSICRLTISAVGCTNYAD